MDLHSDGHICSIACVPHIFCFERYKSTHFYGILVTGTIATSFIVIVDLVIAAEVCRV